MAGYIAIEEAIAIPSLAERCPPFPVPDGMDPAFDAVWAALVELGVPLYLHPGMPPADSWHVLSGPRPGTRR
ncbi:hypothetical protein ACGFRG_00540 [Streptomyces sp. NPDC048696]|uniref:hypothetical protein n=1 Tax=Streptomyces sp. NPDC048696 TaxID=3365585 RepID=UPI00371BCAD7